MRKVCVITSNRAEYWLFKPLLRCLKDSETVQLQLLVAGAHLSDEFGNTIQLIYEDGYKPIAEVPCVPKTDDYVGMVACLSEAVLNFSNAFQKIKPDLIVILGDRFEIFAAAQAAYCLKIPLAHLHGGELTQAALDEGFRHANSKFSHLHFVSHPQYKSRLMRMGEQPDRIWVTGALGIDGMDQFKPIAKSVLSEHLDFDLDQYILLTYHPSTLDDLSPEHVVRCIMEAVNRFSSYQLLITQSNPDPAGRRFNALWRDCLNQYPEKVCFSNTLGKHYHSAVYHSACVLGNSSSGILEVPYLGRPVINMGARQQGRIFPKQVLQTGHDADEIAQAITVALENLKPEVEQVYGQPGTVAKTIARLIEQAPLGNLIQKKFYDA